MLHNFNFNCHYFYTRDIYLKRFIHFINCRYNKVVSLFWLPKVRKEIYFNNLEKVSTNNLLRTFMQTLQVILLV